MISMRCVILFLDVHDFSIACVALRDKGADFIQEMYETLGERIVEAHGTILKYMGDAVMAVFADKAEAAAVRCALESRAAFASLVSRWSLPPSTELEVGIGSGIVQRGTFGHSSFRIEDVFGDEVCLAASICHHRGVAITEAVYLRVKESFATRPLPPRTFKWLPGPVPIWEVTAESPTAPRG
jgi:class 3 adenylate cyclase